MCGFFFVLPSLLNYFFLCELCWLGVFTLCSIYGMLLDSLLFFLFGLLLLGVATGESVLGLLLLVGRFRLGGFLASSTGSDYTLAVDSTRVNSGLGSTSFL
jgi:hypothetical protein